MAVIALDADVLIAFMQADDPQAQRAQDLVAGHWEGGADVVIGASVYSESLVHLLRADAGHLMEEFLQVLRATIVPIDRPIARRAAELRAEHRSLRLPDALSLATAQAAGAELITFDRQLARIAATS